MNEAILIYLYLVFNKIFIASLIISVVGLIGAMFTIASAYIKIDVWDKGDKEYEKGVKTMDIALKYSKPIAICFAIALFLNIALPSRKDIAWIVGGSVAINTVKDNKAELEKLPKNILKVTNSFLEGIEDKEKKKND